MGKRYFLITWIVFSLFLTAFNSTTHAALSSDYQLYLYPYWQFDPQWANVLYDHTNNTIRQKGCALTSLSMLFTYWGLSYLPISWPYCGIDSSPTNPLFLNDWLNYHNGYDSKGNVQWLSMKKFYYCGVYPGWFYQYLIPVKSCYPSSLQGNCFLVDWSSQAEKLLDFDLLIYQPDMGKIKYCKKRNSDGSCAAWGNHFVVISGYNSQKLSYTIHDPGKSYIPPTQEGELAPALSDFYPGAKILRIYRYEGVYTNLAPSVGYLYFYDLSPIQYQIINPQGLITGYDPATGGTIKNIPSANYFEESIDSIDPEAPPSEPSNVLMIDEPPSGNYIIRVFGIGDGPFTVMMSGTSDSGTNIPDTSIITGTAYPGMVEVYRLQYSPTTGQTIITTTNQSPIANAGTDQTVLIDDTVTLDGSGSYDLDGDPLKYTWAIISKPTGSIATLTNSETKTPSFVPDIASQYIIQLTVSDFFVNSSSSDTVIVTAIEPTYIDISLRSLRAPSRMVIGDTKEVTIVVKNLSSIDASFKVTLEDVTEGKIIGTATGIESAGRGGIRVKIPYSPTTAGTHTLRATVMVTNPYSRDPNMENNTLTDTTLVVVR